MHVSLAFQLSGTWHQAAITAALDHVSGDAVVIMDGDLQVFRSIPHS